jgi:integral membrane sensor domain MASE1
VTLWWIGNAIFVLVVIPVVLVLLVRLVKPVAAIERNVNLIHQDAGRIVVALDGVKALVTTRDLVKRVGGGLTRYVTAVDRIL